MLLVGIRPVSPNDALCCGPVTRGLSVSARVGALVAAFAEVAAVVVAPEARRLRCSLISCYPADSLTLLGHTAMLIQFKIKGGGRQGKLQGGVQGERADKRGHRRPHGAEGMQCWEQGE